MRDVPGNQKHTRTSFACGANTQRLFSNSIAFFTSFINIFIIEIHGQKKRRRHFPRLTSLIPIVPLLPRSAGCMLGMSTFDSQNTGDCREVPGRQKHTHTVKGSLLLHVQMAFLCLWHMCHKHRKAIFT